MRVAIRTLVDEPTHAAALDTTTSQRWLNGNRCEENSREFVTKTMQATKEKRANLKVTKYFDHMCYW